MNADSNAAQVTVQLHTEIKDRNNHTERLSLTAMGSLYEKAEALFLTYDEELAEAGKVKTIIKMKDKHVTIIRSGAVSMRQIFISGEKTSGIYRSAAGAMEMVTITDKIEVSKQERTGDGRLTLSYRLRMQGQEVGRYRLTLSFSEQDKEVSQ